MHANYHLHASNLISYEKRGLLFSQDSGQDSGRDVNDLDAIRESVVTAGNWSVEDMQIARLEMEQRLEACDSAIRPYLLDMYANPVQTALDAIARQNTPD